MSTGSPPEPHPVLRSEEHAAASPAPRARPGAAGVLTIPNLISALRLAAVPAFAFLALNGQDLWALATLAVAGASDWLDGRLARALNQQSRLGELLDPAADRLFILATLIILAVRDLVPWWLVAVIIARDVLLTVVLLALVAARLGPLPVHFVGKAGTFALLYAFPLLLLAERPGVIGAAADALGWGFAVWGIALYWLAGAVYLRQAASYLAESARARHS